MNALATREAVNALQAAMIQHPQVELPTAHLFHAGMYCRVVEQAAGVLVVGKVHKRPHFFMVVSGTVLITAPPLEPQEITGPRLLLSEPGTKRVIYAVTDVVYMTFHTSRAKTVKGAEDKMVEPDATSPFGVGNRLKALQ